MKVKEESEKPGLKLNVEKNEDYSIWSHHFMANRWGNNGNSDRLYFWGGSKITTDGDCSHEIKRHLLLGRKVMNHLDSILKSRDITLPTKVRLVKAMVFSSSHVWMWELDCKESWVWKNWYFWTAVLVKTLESPLGNKEIQPVHPRGNQFWIFIGRTDAEAESPGTLQSMESKRVGHNWATELNWTDSFRPHGLLHARLPCPSSTLGACLNSCPSSRWCHPTISSSVIHPLLLLPSIFPSIRVFSNESGLLTRWPEYWSFSFSISPSSEYSGLISFGMHWLDLAIQGALCPIFLLLTFCYLIA